MIGHCFHSRWNVYRAYRLRKEWRSANRERLRAIMRDERAHLIKALPLVTADRRMGFHSECQRYLFTAAAIRRKLRRLAEAI